MENQIGFYNEDISFRLRNIRVKRSWLLKCIESEGKKTGCLNIVFCSDDYLHTMNLNYLNHDDYTDIITFDYSEKDAISGDIFISINRVKENSAAYSVNFNTELNRVMVHGVLHLCGYKDKSKKHAQIMRKKEDEKLKLL
ncbi:MAG: rRNA maturation RNase YbeY [Lentimicrobium sp.]|nr:rRNA maturation RNase YbeY [Lentimicrobium sp.]